jgi:putative membrane protein
MMGPGYGYGYTFGGYSWFGMLLMMLFGTLVVVGIVLLIIWAARAGSHGATGGGMPQRPGAAGHDEAITIAKRRLASGEITKEQYDEIMRALG